jgi:hypothetical protein
MLNEEGRMGERMRDELSAECGMKKELTGSPCGLPPVGGAE